MNLSEAIKKLKSENELCLENREGECGGYNYKDGKCYCAGSIIVRALEEYIKIGTVEECREARERQIPIKPKGIYKTRYIWDSAYCPVCGCGITARWNFCQSCGQAISWESDTP